MSPKAGQRKPSKRSGSNRNMQEEGASPRQRGKRTRLAEEVVVTPPPRLQVTKTGNPSRDLTVVVRELLSTSRETDAAPAFIVTQERHAAVDAESRSEQLIGMLATGFAAAIISYWRVQVRQVFERIRQPTLPEDIVKKFVQTWAESMTASVQAQMEALLRDCFATPAA